MPLTAKEIGDLGECRAAWYLRLHGYWIRERNWRAGKCELDIIASTPSDIVFVEVKTRTYTSIAQLETAPPPGIAVNAEKQRLTRQAARAYLSQYAPGKRPRMDVIEVWLLQPEGKKKPRVAKLHHIKAAY